MRTERANVDGNERDLRSRSATLTFSPYVYRAVESLALRNGYSVEDEIRLMVECLVGAHAGRAPDQLAQVERVLDEWNARTRGDKSAFDPYVLPREGLNAKWLRDWMDRQIQAHDPITQEALWTDLGISDRTLSRWLDAVPDFDWLVDKRQARARHRKRNHATQEAGE